METRAGSIMRKIGCAATSEKRNVICLLASIRTSASVREDTRQIISAEVKSENERFSLRALFSAVFLLKSIGTPDEDKAENRKKTERAI